MSPAERVELMGAARVIERELGPYPDFDYVVGRTVFRDILTVRLEMSTLSAEGVVDVLEECGVVRFEDGPEGRGWVIELDPHLDEHRL